MLIHHASKQPPGERRPSIVYVMDRVSSAELRAWVETISVPRHYVAQAENNQWVCRWLSDQLRSWGYAVDWQGKFDNVVALPPDPNKPFLLVGAHYDSVPMTDGADDNGSAVAALLGCAKALHDFRKPQRVGFALFNREEDSLQGSRDFVENFVLPRRLPIDCAHVLEMVGFASSAPGSQRVPAGLPISIPDKGDFLGLLANHSAAAAQTGVLRAARTYLPEFSVLGLHVTLGLEKFFPVLHRSDHAPFWQHGIPSVMWTDTSEFRNPNYHTFDDTPATLNYEFLRAVTQLLIACALNFENET